MTINQLTKKLNKIPRKGAINKARRLVIVGLINKEAAK